ncbi:MAG TPA: hypothetical protein VKW76_00260 [Candidatus Binatia bacterium]|nr:hypothetical protein [Candidatus Binatia bacterium]
MLEDVPPLVDFAALDDRRRPARLPDRLADGRVLGRGRAEGEDVLLALGTHARREHDDMVAGVEPVDDENADGEIVQRPGEPGGELRGRERDEAARDAALRDNPFASPGGQRVERAAVLARRDADRERDAVRIGLGTVR